ncbi:MAG: heavy-metal-associated domain-containing protein [Actinomycetota bacterium]
MTDQILKVPEIHCAHCKESIEGAVSALDGVQNVRVDIDPRTVNLSYDETQVDLEAIKQAIESVGYEVPEQA